ncbi:hypothetical protein J1N35_033477 [Gossypium stocksii]|uniref:RNase H type-1 domain-containing protein n=1 Tax=Gossypium stocksii TaxID=47602 RepID=A0A9D3UQ85_9ROSI|nr:hypothetical protein J1N35_033477 [Gossypium stocksii]
MCTLHLHELGYYEEGSAVVAGNNGTAGISGILRDHKGASLVIFSKSAGLADPTLAEVLAIKVALTIYSACRWSGTHKLLVESDCIVVVSWYKSSWNAPSCVWSIIQLCFGICRGQSWDIIEILNGTTDRLTKAGINRQVNLPLVCG